MRAGFDLPPLMFKRDEAQALVAAVRLAQPRLDQAMAAQAERALSKILAVLPAPARAAAESLAAWCELRQDTRSFRIDRIQQLSVLDEHFRDEPGKTLPDQLRAVEGERPSMTP
jgi:predicted DNA-binding transcriptional regulator YafY